MGCSILHTLVIALLAPPVVLMATHIFTFRASAHRNFTIRTALATLSFFILAINEVVFLHQGIPYYFFHTIIDALVLLGAPFALEPRQHPSSRSKKLFLFLYVFLLTLFLIMGVYYAFHPMRHIMWLSTTAAVATALFGIAEYRTTDTRHARLFILVLLLWCARHIMLPAQPYVVNQTLALGFFALLTIIPARYIYLAQQSICNENRALFSLWDRISNLLKRVNRSTENIHSLETIHTHLLTTIVDTLSARGAALYTSKSPGIGTPLLQFSGLVGRFFPLEPVDDPSLLKWQKLITDRLKGSTYRAGNGLVGIVAQREDALVIDRATDMEYMRQLRLNTDVLAQLIAIPLLIHEQLYGVVVVQNHKENIAFSENDATLLRIITGISALAIDQAEIYMELTKTGRLRKEADIARTIQNQLLPKNIPQTRHLQTSVFFKPAREVGGDYYDFIDHEDGSQGIIIGDVSGKGVPAGMLMAIAKAVLHIVARGTHDVKDIVSRFAREMYGNIRTKQFITCNYLRWDDATRTLSFAGAGHEHVLWFHADTGIVERIKTGGVAIGFMEDASAHITTTTLQPKKGDAVALYTDGITELRNEKDEMFSLSRLQSAFENYAYLGNPEQIIDRVMDDVFTFMGTQEQYDDIILMVMSVR
jgi:serine phosphatase RsbU (regulator of sigma subunit)